MWVVRYRDGDGDSYYLRGDRQLSWWTFHLIEAFKFKSCREAETDAFMYAVYKPDYIGELEIIPVTLEQRECGGSFWNEETIDETHSIH